MYYKAETRLTAQWEQVPDVENTLQTTVIGILLFSKD
jgi:hypothetical protein